jgi:hypothetical protein
MCYKKIDIDFYKPKNAMDKIKHKRTVEKQMIPKVGLGDLMIDSCETIIYPSCLLEQYIGFFAILQLEFCCSTIA